VVTRHALAANQTGDLMDPSTRGDLVKFIRGRLLFILRKRVDQRPTLGRAAPDLGFWHKLVALIDGADPEAEHSSTLANRFGVNTGAAFWAKRAGTQRPAVRYAFVGSQFPGNKRKGLISNSYNDSIGRARMPLATRAMADYDEALVDRCLVANVSAKTFAGNLHLFWFSF
jgi:hypothetical protein